MDSIKNVDSDVNVARMEAIWRAVDGVDEAAFAVGALAPPVVCESPFVGVSVGTDIDGTGVVVSYDSEGVAAIRAGGRSYGHRAVGYLSEKSTSKWTPGQVTALAEASKAYIAACNAIVAQYRAANEPLIAAYKAICPNNNT